MAKPGFTSAPHKSLPEPEVRTQRETRSLARKRHADQIAESEGVEDMNRDTLDSSHPEATVDREKRSMAQNTARPKRARKYPSINNNGSQIKDLQNRIKDLETLKKTLGTKIGKLETAVKNVTKESVLNARKGTKGVWDKAKMQTEFINLKRDIKNWVKRYGTTTKISAFPDAHKKDILSACEIDQYREVFSKGDFDAIQELSKGAHLLLEGFLYAQAVHVLVSRPFVFIDAMFQEHSRPNNTILGYGNNEHLFAEFAEGLTQCNDFPDQRERWTASMLQSLKRMIIPEPLDGIVSHLKDEKSVDSYRIYELGIAQLGKQFVSLEKPARYLLNDCLDRKQCDQRRESLKIIYRKFREVAYHM
ncbi:hypothetical protein TMatcc_010385 [Talaromyces marneffei ATCC 18224]|uniref:uncharacterized protein n=1 Tax=Talaromyces marneffei TaxID=37727 RepID=UPI0012A9F7D4|nr:uncharacterized protein EYB26_009821 [Talaromyces marneffei]KAE8548763.1 hypothetical protein EYB25_009144 [Talaromyces marneffei]QGA22107.1 hypothetical protein EYB26_009821 [Talaromyces marneffei]